MTQTIIDKLERADGPDREWSDIMREAERDSGDDTVDFCALAYRDGFSRAVQLIDEQTGGDGEYCYALGVASDRHCPDPPAMIARIVERLRARSQGGG